MRNVSALVNARAHRVTPAVVAAFTRALGAARVHVTRSLDDAAAAVAAMVADGCDVACIAGGDGTFIQAASDVIALAPARPPILFGLPYGLGNAIADISGASAPTAAGLARDLARAAGNERSSPLALVRANGRVAYYAGVGMDAIFVEDLYAVAKGRWRRVAATLRGAPGLVATVVGRTLPRLLAYRAPTVRVVAAGPAAPLDSDGRRGADVPAGTVLYAGSAMMAAGGTIASYGKGFQSFPFVDAATPDRFQLRVWAIGARAVLRHLPALWRGTYAPSGGVHDWAATAVRITWLEPHVIHIGGDLCPATTSLDIAMIPESVPILRRRRYD